MAIPLPGTSPVADSFTSFPQVAEQGGPASVIQILNVFRGVSHGGALRHRFIRVILTDCFPGCHSVRYLGGMLTTPASASQRTTPCLSVRPRIVRWPSQERRARHLFNSYFWTFRPNLVIPAWCQNQAKPQTNNCWSCSTFFTGQPRHES